MSGPDRRTEADHLRELANRKREPAPEGWGVKRPQDQRWHYYRNGRSFCGRVGFYRGHLDPDDGALVESDCRACRKVLERAPRGEPGNG